MASIRYNRAEVDGFNVFYREAGNAAATKLLLLQGFPTAGHMFRDLIPLLADRYHMIAPDLPGSGQSDMPPRGEFGYTLENLARVIGRFTEVEVETEWVPNDRNGAGDRSNLLMSFRLHR